MIRDASTYHHAHAEPPADSRWSAFAQWMRFMSNLLSDKIDARTLWVPLSVALIIFMTCAGTLVGLTVWLTNLSNRANMATELSGAIEELSKAQSRAEGKIDTLVGMQGDLAETKAEISGLKSRMDSQARRLETMDVWIQDTRDRLKDEGFSPPEYRPGGQP